MCVCECVYIVPRLYLLVCEFVCMCAYVCMCVLTLNWPRPPSLQTLAGKHQFFKPKNYLLSEKVWGPGAAGVWSSRYPLLLPPLPSKLQPESLVERIGEGRSPNDVVCWQGGEREVKRRRAVGAYMEGSVE